MKLSTHLFILHKVKEFIDREYSSDININTLCFGNVFADLSVLSMTHPHYRSRSMNYINGKIKELCSYIPNASDDFGMGYALRLGIITHYISDFFCQAHKGRGKGNAKDHIMYEFGLRDFVEGNYKELDKYDFSNDFKAATDFEGITDRLNEWLDEYLANNPSYEKDIIMAIRATCFVTASIMSICLIQKQRVFEMLITAYCMPKYNGADAVGF